MRKTTLVIMAAGIGSRFGQGIKQLQAIGLNGEIIMDYSIHDAIEVGFNKIVFIIRKDIEKDFKSVIGNRIETICSKLNVEVCYVFQEMSDVPMGVTVPKERKKPWGTGQAILACKKVVQEPFAVLNADDYYGKEAFRKVYEFLQQDNMTESKTICMAGFRLGNTLSEHGGVTRGICKMDESGYLQNIVEMRNIEKMASGAQCNGEAIDINSLVSMNMWGLSPRFITMLENGFLKFFDEIEGNELNAEYLLPVFIGECLGCRNISVKVLETNDKWFGITYKEDIEKVCSSFRKLIGQGMYCEKLFDDLLARKRR